MMNSSEKVTDWNTAVHLVAMSNLPGCDFVAKGLEDLWRSHESPEAMLVAVASPRLIKLGLPLPDSLPHDPNLRLYALLCESHGDAAYSQYNSRLRCVTSFARAAECIGWR
jgi:hypothetical protein